jgi:hypothetical protein
MKLGINKRSSLFDHLATKKNTFKTLTPVVNVLKLFETLFLRQMGLECFSMALFFCLIDYGQSKPSGGVKINCSTLVDSDLTSQHQSSLQKSFSATQSSLFCYNVNNKEKSFLT